MFGFSRRRLRYFLVVALVATGIDLFGYLGLSELGFRWWAADIAALSAAAVVGISAHRRFTLRNDPNVRWIHRPAAFLSSGVLSGVVDLGVLALFTDRGALAKILAIAAAATIRALSNRFFLFSSIRGEQSAPSNRLPPEGSLRLSVIVPAYKEAEHIAETVGALHGHLSDVLEADAFEILVIDDGSDDGTADIAEATGKARGILLPANLGKGGAVRVGMREATGRSRVFLDADLAYGPAEAVRLMHALEDGWDVVVGTRRESRLVTNTGAGLLRDAGGRLVNIATHLLLLGQYRDTQAGCKGFRGDVADLIFSTGKLNGFSFDIEIFHLVERWRLSLLELPMTIASSERTTVNVVSDTLTLFADMARIRRWSARGEYLNEDGLAALPPAQSAMSPTDIEGAGPGEQIDSQKKKDESHG